MRLSPFSRPICRLEAAHRLLGLLCALLIGATLISRAWAAVPVSATLTATGPSVSWTGTETGTGADSATASNETGCSPTLNNCDTFTLTIGGQPSDYKGKVVAITDNWKLISDEYDLFIHVGGSVSGSLVAASSNGANGNGTPATSNVITIDPTNPMTPPGVYTIHVASAIGSTLDQYSGTAVVEANATPMPRAGTYSLGAFQFSNDVPLKAPVAVADGEPSSRTDKYGNFYESGIRGFPAGIDLWYFDLRPMVGGAANPTYDPLMRYPIYKDQPDGFTGMESATDGINAGGDGGGDVDLTVGFDNSTLGTVSDNPATTPANPTLAFASLIAANLSTGSSQDRANTYKLNSAGNFPGGIPVNDRQWLEAFGTNTVYMLYRTITPDAVISQIQQSTDGGLTYGPAQTAGIQNQTASLDVDPTDGTVFLGFNDGSVSVGKPNATLGFPVTGSYTTYKAASDPNGVAHIFFECQVAHDSGTGAGKNGKPYGTVYCLYSNGIDVFLEYSLDRAQTFSTPVRVDDPATIGTHFNIFPRMALGTTFGSVGIVWYGTSDSGVTLDPATGTPLGSEGSPTALWKAYYGLTYDATDAAPAFQEAAASNHYIHAGNISESGLVLTGTNPNRNLLDYFEVSFDPTGAAVIGYTDDHNDFSGECFAVRQIGGPSINPGAVVPAPKEGPAAKRQTAFGINTIDPIPGPFGAQVTDWTDDVSYGLVVTVPNSDPLDITAVKYFVNQTPSGPSLIAKMTVSSLATIPAESSWRMSFAANCPNSILDPTGTYSFGASDLGDQFYLEVDSGASGTQTATYGTIARDVSGGLTYTMLGTADSFSFDTTHNSITARISLSELNAHLMSIGHPLIKTGSILAGLRGSTFDSGSGGTVKGDTTYGGSQYIVP